MLSAPLTVPTSRFSCHAVRIFRSDDLTEMIFFIVKTFQALSTTTHSFNTRALVVPRYSRESSPDHRGRTRAVPS